MSLRTLALTGLLAFVAAVPASAQTQQLLQVGELSAIAQAPPSILAQQSLPPLVQQQTQLPSPMPAPAQPYFKPESRPAWIFGVHAMTAVMQGLDAHSTFSALEAEGIEMNPIVKSFADHRGAFTAMKVGVAAGVIYATDRMAKRHPYRALIIAGAINSAYAMIAANNYKVARGIR